MRDALEGCRMEKIGDLSRHREPHLKSETETIFQIRARDPVKSGLLLF